MSTAGISIGQPRVGTTLTDLTTQFAKASNTQHLRFSDTQGLHTHSKYGASMVDFLAKFRNADALQARADLRQGAVDKVKTAIDNEFGAGMGERVFARALERGDDMSHGVTKGDLHTLHNYATELRNHDIQQANDRLGDGGITGIFGKGWALGIDFSDRSPEDMNLTRFAIADAVNGLPHDATPLQIERAALGALMIRDFQLIAKEVCASNPGFGKPGYNRAEFASIKQSVEQFSLPGGRYEDVGLDVAVSVLEPYVLRASVPNRDELVKDVARHAAVALPMPEKREEIEGFVSDLVTREGGLQSNDIDAFMRGNPGSPDDPGFVAFAIVSNSVGSGYTDIVDQCVSTLGKLKKLEYREDKLRNLKPEEQISVANASVDAIDDVMALLFGGKTDIEIQQAVDRLPQEFCDLLAQGHDAIDKNVEFHSSIPREEREGIIQHMHDMLDMNFLTLRSINPMFTDKVGANPKLGGTIIAMTKLIQDTANGVLPSSKGKEPVHPSVAERLDSTVAEWSKVHDIFMQKARERGVVV